MNILFILGIFNLKKIKYFFYVKSIYIKCWKKLHLCIPVFIYSKKQLLKVFYFYSFLFYNTA